MQGAQGDKKVTLKSFMQEFRNYLFRDRLSFYVQLLAIQVIVYTVILHYSIPYLEGVELSWSQSALFVLQTMTTVGYDLLTFFPVNNTITVILIIVIMCTGVFTFLMIIPAVLTPYIQEVFKPLPPSRLHENLKDHVIVAGYNEISKSLVDSLLVSQLDIVLVEEDEKKGLDALNYYKKNKKSVKVILGNYNENATWTGVGVSDARDIIICEWEKKSATILLGIRNRTRATITAIVDDLSYERYLKYAGADHVISPKDFTGKVLARHISLTPEVDILFQASVRNGEKRISEDKKNPLKFIYLTVTGECPVIGKTLDELSLFETYGVDPVFIMDKGNFHERGGGDIKIQRSTTLFLLGRSDALSRLVGNMVSCSPKKERLAVISGFGDLGRVVYSELKDAGIQSYVIDPKAEEPYVIKGYAQEESVLIDAHINEAEVCVAAVNDDEVNIFTTLIARNLNHSIHILARANKPGSVEKLYRAGADYVTLLPTTSGQIAAGIVLHNIVSVLLDLPGNKKVIMKKSSVEGGVTAGWCENASGAKIIAVEGKEDAAIRPSPDQEVRPGDCIIAFGDVQSLRKLISILSGGKK
ncbi:Trk K+ transport system NAD-binding subunit [Methanomicrobium sp. W14]|uniref:potassium channel family protein n=1 Tax=Methanomicrobium sp. W14 TaxID=2817839 RepID=UPI001AE1F016|nr:NAD-binding protein [Methanomicrobium sp. W14]MBP2134320.1 Trk K+ transport system NAD-binding subunit [Methanomicrobium sp. W14]